MKPVAVLVGGGFMAAAHLEALRRLNIEIAGIVAGRPENTQRAANRFGLKPYPDTWAALNDPAVTVVHDCAPNDIHLDINLAALKAGKHVFSEKPLGITPQETRRQWDAARASGLQHGVNFTYRGYAMVRELRERVLRGDLGEIRFVRGRYLQDWLLYPHDYNWRLEAKAEETRALSDIGSHLLDLIRYVTGLEATRLLARFAQMHPRRYRPDTSAQTFSSHGQTGTPFEVQTEDQATLLVEYAKVGANLEYAKVGANLEMAQVYAGHHNDFSLEILGTQASASWSQERPEEIVFGYRDRPAQTLYKSSVLTPQAAAMAHYPAGHPEGYADALTNLIRAFYSGLEGQPSHYPTFEDGHAVAVAVAAAVKSHDMDRWVGLWEIEGEMREEAGKKQVESKKF